MIAGIRAMVICMVLFASGLALANLTRNRRQSR